MVQLGRSRAVEAAGYDHASRRLRILFRHGGLYDYLEVPPNVHAGLISSPHPWTEYGAHIKSTYECVRLS